jgi:hypothetical protein
MGTNVTAVSRLNVTTSNFWRHFDDASYPAEALETRPGGFARHELGLARNQSIRFLERFEAQESEAEAART